MTGVKAEIEVDGKKHIVQFDYEPSDADIDEAVDFIRKSKPVQQPAQPAQTQVVQPKQTKTAVAPVQTPKQQAPVSRVDEAVKAAMDALDYEYGYAKLYVTTPKQKNPVYQANKKEIEDTLRRRLATPGVSPQSAIQEAKNAAARIITYRTKNPQSIRPMTSAEKAYAGSPASKQRLEQFDEQDKEKAEQEAVKDARGRSLWDQLGIALNAKGRDNQINYTNALAQVLSEKIVPVGPGDNPVSRILADVVSGAITLPANVVANLRGMTEPKDITDFLKSSWNMGVDLIPGGVVAKYGGKIVKPIAKIVKGIEKSRGANKAIAGALKSGVKAEEVAGARIVDALPGRNSELINDLKQSLEDVRAGVKTDVPPTKFEQSQAAKVMPERDLTLGLEQMAEAKKPKIEPEVTGTSIKNRSVEADRAALGLNDLPKPERQSFEGWIAKAKEQKIDAEADKIAKRVLDSGEDLSETESAGIALRMSKLKQDHASIIKDINKALDEGADASTLSKQLADIEDEFDTLSKATKQSGTSTARALVARKLTIDDDYELISTLQRARARAGRDLTDAERGVFEKNTASLKQKDLDVEAARSRVDMFDAEDVAKEIRSKGVVRAEKRIQLEQEWEALVKKLPKDIAGIGANRLPTEGIKTIGKMGVNLIQRTALTVDEVVEQVLKKVKEHYPDATERDVRDSISGYYRELEGPSPKTLDEAAKRVREYKQILRLTSKLEDAEKGLVRGRPRQDLLTKRAETLQKKLDDLSAKRNKTVRDQKTIQNLKTQIANAKKGIAPEPKPRAPQSPEIQELKRQLREAQKPQGPGKPPRETTVERLKRQIADAERGVAPEPAKRPTVSPEVQALRKELDAKLKERGLGRFSEEANAAAIRKRLQGQIDELNQRLKDEDFKARVKERKPLSDELDKLAFERDQLKGRIKEAERALAPKGAWDKLSDAMGVPRSLMSTGDMSYLMRQGLVLNVRNPVEGAKIFAKAARAMFDAPYAASLQRDMLKDPAYRISQRAKLYIANLPGQVGPREEAFITGFAEKLPVIGKIVKASERNMVTGLNELRFHHFKAFLERYPNATPEELKAFAGYLNAASGRGSLGRFEGASEPLAKALFSPRLLTSRFQAPAYAVRPSVPAIVRREAQKDMVKLVVAGNLAIGLAMAGGAETSLDPDSPDFGKIKMGDQRFDIWGGFQQPARLLARIAKGIAEKLREAGGGPEAEEVDIWNLLTRYFEYKQAPGLSMARTALSGKDAVGNEVSLSDYLIKAFTPLNVSEIISVAKEKGWLSKEVAGAGAAGFVGVGSSTYKN